MLLAKSVNFGIKMVLPQKFVSFGLGLQKGTVSILVAKFFTGQFSKIRRRNGVGAKKSQIGAGGLGIFIQGIIMKNTFKNSPLGFTLTI